MIVIARHGRPPWTRPVSQQEYLEAAISRLELISRLETEGQATVPQTETPAAARQRERLAAMSPDEHRAQARPATPVPPCRPSSASCSLTRCLILEPPTRRQGKLDRSETTSPWKLPTSLRPRKFMTSLAPKHSVLWLSSRG